MSGGPVAGGGGRQNGSFWPEWLSFRRFARAVRQIWSLNESVAALKRDSQQMRADIAALQREQAAQGKQIEMLAGFVQSAINERIDVRAENAAYRILASLRHLPETGDDNER